MAEFVIEGRTRTKGKVRPGGNKNAAFPAVAAALLTSEPVTLRKVREQFGEGDILGILLASPYESSAGKLLVNLVHGRT